MKEKKQEEIRVMVQSSLYKDFKKTCGENYKTISEVIRDFMVQYIKKESKNGRNPDKKVDN